MVFPFQPIILTNTNFEIAIEICGLLLRAKKKGSSVSVLREIIWSDDLFLYCSMMQIPSPQKKGKSKPKKKNLATIIMLMQNCQTLANQRWCFYVVTNLQNNAISFLNSNAVNRLLIVVAFFVCYSADLCNTISCLHNKLLNYIFFFSD